jgi:hypothetical protein
MSTCWLELSPHMAALSAGAHHHTRARPDRKLPQSADRALAVAAPTVPRNLPRDPDRTHHGMGKMSLGQRLMRTRTRVSATLIAAKGAGKGNRAQSRCQ